MCAGTHTVVWFYIFVRKQNPFVDLHSPDDKLHKNREKEHDDMQVICTYVKADDSAYSTFRCFPIVFMKPGHQNPCHLISISWPTWNKFPATNVEKIFMSYRLYSIQ